MSQLFGDIKYDQASSLRKMVGKATDVASTTKFQSEDETELHSKKQTLTNGTRIISVTSGKGGVGKTSVSVNMAMALARAGQKVLLFDADLGLANINVLLGIIPKYNLYHVIKGHKKLSDIIINTPEGVDIIAGASGYSQLANLEKEERGKIIMGFDELKGYDILIIDTGAGVGANVVGFSLPAEDVVVVTTSEPTSITDAYGIIKSIVLLEPDKSIKLVVNRVKSSLEGRKVAERVISICNQFLNVKVENCGFIFDDENVAKSIRKQKPFYTLYPKGKASSCLNLIASRIVNQEIDPVDRSSGLGSFFKKMLQNQADLEK